MLEFKFQISDTYEPHNFMRELVEVFTEECDLLIEIELLSDKHEKGHNTYLAKFTEPLAVFYLGKSVSSIIH